MDEVTQQNSALVEENAATAKTLETQSKAMDDQVNKFVVEGVAVARGAPVPVPVQKARAPAPKLASAAPQRGPVGQMHSKLATALKQEEWSEF
jgi:hypothetical protein